MERSKESFSIWIGTEGLMCEGRFVSPRLENRHECLYGFLFLPWLWRTASETVGHMHYMTVEQDDGKDQF